MATNFLRVHNFGLGFLAAGVNSTVTTLTLQQGDLANFPAPGASADRYRVVVGREIMEVTGIDAAANTLTVIRAQEGTTGLSHLALSVVSIRLTAAGVRSMQDVINTLENSLGTIQIRVNSGADAGDRPRVHFLDGTNVDISAVDDVPNEEVQVTINVNLDTYTVAGLPAGSLGDMALATDGRKTGEGAAAGTGVMVYHDGTAWRRVDDGTTVAA